MAVKALSSSERTEIKLVLDARRDRQQDELLAKHPTWKTDLETRLTKIAVGKLGVEKGLAELEKLEGQIRTLQEKADAVSKEIATRMPLHARPAAGRFGNAACPTRKDLCTAVSDIVLTVRLAETQKDPVGKLSAGFDVEYATALEKLAKCTTREDVAKAGILN